MDMQKRVIPDQIERIAHRVIGCAIRVHQVLGPGLLEAMYERAMMIELAKQGLQAKAQVEVKITYDDQPIGTHRLDLIVESCVLVELKAVEVVTPVFKAQVISSLRLADASLGLLMNFNVPVLKDGLTRFINPQWSGFTPVSL